MCGLSQKCPNQKGSNSFTFLDYVLDFVVGHGMFSFMDGYNRYNHVKMAKEDKDKTIFIL
jgi:hypothetical protein